MLKFGVDEFTLVIQISSSLKVLDSSGVFDWESVAENVILKFEAKADLINTFGYRFKEERAPNGYKTAYTYGQHVFYFAVAYHPLHRSMGIAVKFSGQSLDYYCEKTGLQIYKLLQKIVDPDYSIRLSRIDLTCDFINEDIDPTNIYQDLINDNIGIFREYEGKSPDNPIYKRCFMQYRGYIKAEEIPTIYLGSVQSNSELRIYDKKREQIERKGSKYDEALKCKNWVRFEGVFRHKYAHQITEELLKLQTDIELANLIACIMVQKFRFMKMNNGIADCDTDYTQMIIDAINFNNFTLKSPSSRNYDLAKSIAYIFCGSGVMNTLYKIQYIWGDDAIDDFLDFIKESLIDWEPNDDCNYWLLKNTDDYLLHYPNFDSFRKQNVSYLISNAIKEKKEN